MAAMRVATWCERCGSAVAESGIWIGRSGVRVYCSACGYLSPPSILGAGHDNDAVVIDLRHPALSGPRRPA